MQMPFSCRATLSVSVLAALAAFPAVAKNTAKAPNPSPIPYSATSTPGVSVRSVPSAPHAGGAGQVYILPGGKFPTRAAERPATPDARYTPFARPDGTVMVYLDPSQAIQETAHVTSAGKLVTSCGDEKAPVKANVPGRVRAAKLAAKSKGGKR